MSYPITQIGEVWRQVKGEFIGRKVVILGTDNDGRFVLYPYPGNCKCPAKQITTRMSIENFLRQFEPDVDEE